MNSVTYDWIDAAKHIPEAKDYNKDGCVIVAYEDGTVSKGYYTLSDRWAFQELHGKAMFWTQYPEHPKKEETFKRYIG